MGKQEKQSHRRNGQEEDETSRGGLQKNTSTIKNSRLVNYI